MGPVSVSLRLPPCGLQDIEGCMDLLESFTDNFVLDRSSRIDVRYGDFRVQSPVMFVLPESVSLLHVVVSISGI